MLSIGSGAPVFIAEYDPFCPAGVRGSYPGVVSDIDIIVPSTGKFNITPHEEDEEQRVLWKYQTL